ncbi:MAG TPA: response regulator transcription factor [Hellea balneolensis]|uniref:Response regulator transcription factor n=1 Tax=Hellea balneolensis TaxID=287478 RepID=A0A7C5M0U8_9PROT|nr:response regulator transcription factor [Hellea balneolensis]
MSVKKRLLIVDDDDDLREELVEQFGLYDEFETDDVDTAGGAITATKDKDYDLILLDVDLPDMLGTEACQLMRKNGVAAPIVMLTGNDGEMNEILGLNSGANDYITKPFRFAVMLARLRAHLRSFEQSEDAVFQLGPYMFKPAFKRLEQEGEREIRLTEKETNILKYLYRSGGKPVGREELLHEVWGYNSGVTTHTLETHIYRLRQKIEPEKGRATLLITEPGGYRLELG